MPLLFCSKIYHFRFCIKSPKHTYTIVQLFHLIGVFTSKCRIVRISLTRRFSIVGKCHYRYPVENSTIFIIISMTNLKTQAERGKPDEYHCLWTQVKHCRKHELSSDCVQRLEKWSEISWRAVQWETVIWPPESNVAFRWRNTKAVGTRNMRLHCNTCCVEKGWSTQPRSGRKPAWLSYTHRSPDGRWRKMYSSILNALVSNSQFVTFTQGPQNQPFAFVFRYLFSLPKLNLRVLLTRVTVFRHLH